MQTFRDEQSESRYLKAGDLGDKRPNLVVDRVETEELTDFNDSSKKVMKAVLYFVNQEKGVVLNVTNLDEMISAYGDDSDGWVGKTVMLKTKKYEGFNPGIVVTALGSENPDGVPF